MMNIIALGLLLSSIVSAGFFSPPPPPQPKQTASETYVLKETDRVTILEFERESVPIDQNKHTPTRPPPPQASQEPSVLEKKLDSERAMAGGVYDTAKQAGSVLPNMGSDGHTYSPKELICDAYGKCKHKLAGVFGKAKEGKDAAGEGLEAAVEKTKEGMEKGKEVGEMVMDKAQEGLGKAKDGVYTTGEMAVEKTKEGIGKAKDSVYETGEMAVEKTKEGLGLGKANDRVYTMGEKVKEGLGKAKDSVYETGEMAVEKTKEGLGLGKAKDGVYTTGEKVKEGLGKAKDSVYETGEMAVDKTKEGLSKANEALPEKMQEAGKMAAEHAKRVGQGLKEGHNAVWDKRSLKTKASGLFHEGSMNFSSVLHRGINALNTLVSKEVVQPTVGVAHLIAMSTAYGTTIWVTFVSSHVLAGALPRQQFGMVQSRVYPVYFRFLVGCIGCALGSQALKHPYLGLDSFATYVLLGALGFVLVNLLLLEPQATKVMFEKMRLEKEEGGGRTTEEEEEEEEIPVGPGRASSTATETAPGTTRAVEPSEEVNARLEELDTKLKNLNAISSCLNVATLVFMTWQLIYLGKITAGA